MKHRRFTIFLVLLILWSGLFAFLTLQNGPDTTATSLGLAHWLQRVLHLSTDTETLHLLLRKAAHIVCLAGEGLLLTLMLCSTPLPRRRCVLISLLVCFALAVVSEAVKIPIAGRHFSWLDSGLNALGAAVGVAVASGIVSLWSRQQH